VVYAARLLSLALQDPHMCRRVQFIETGCNPDVDYSSLHSFCLSIKVNSFDDYHLLGDDTVWLL
jgi:hypothetical protein